MKKTISMLLVVLLMFSLVGCSKSKSSNETADTAESTNSQEVSVAATESEDSTGEEAAEDLSGNIKFLAMSEYHDALQTVVDAFEQKYPNVTVEMEEYPYSQLFDAIEIKLGSQNSDFDVVLTDATMVSGYAYRGFIAPLDDYFSEEEKNEFASALIASGTYDGKFFSPPLKNSCHVLWYNKDLLDKAGIEYPSSDPAERMTWEEVAEMSEKVMKAANSPTVYGLTFEQISRPYQILPLPNSLGGKGIGEDGLTVDGYLNSDAFVKALQWYYDIHNTYNISPKGISASETVGQFTAGNIAFISANIFDYKTFEKTEGLNYGYAPLPYFEGGTPATPTDSFHVSVSNFSNNKDLAAEFVKYLTLGEGNDIYLETQGELSARVDVLNSYDTEAKYDEFPLSVFRLAAYEAQNTAYPRPQSLGYREWESTVEATFEDIRNGADVKEALDSAVAEIDVQMSVYK